MQGPASEFTIYDTYTQDFDPLLQRPAKHTFNAMVDLQPMPIGQQHDAFSFSGLPSPTARHGSRTVKMVVTHPDEVLLGIVDRFKSHLQFTYTHDGWVFQQSRFTSIRHTWSAFRTLHLEITSDTYFCDPHWEGHKVFHPEGK